MAVIVENGEHGSSTAAPVARKVFDAYLLGPPAVTDPVSEPPAGVPPAPTTVIPPAPATEGQPDPVAPPGERPAAPPIDPGVAPAEDVAVEPAATGGRV